MLLGVGRVQVRCCSAQPIKPELNQTSTARPTCIRPIGWRFPATITVGPIGRIRHVYAFTYLPNLQTSTVQ